MRRTGIRCGLLHSRITSTVRSRDLCAFGENAALTDWYRVLDNCGVGGYGLHSWYVRPPPTGEKKPLLGILIKAEKMDMKIIHQSQTNPFLLNADEEKSAVKRHRENTRQLTVPRRPTWDSTTTPAELDRAEKDSFLQWRRGLAQLEESKDLLMTPFERNLEVWRQLWRVIERSDLVVQIVDARNPMLFRCEDLERYVKEVGPQKRNLLLVNKADMMTLEQRLAWADYFEKERIRYRFFSAALAKQSNEELELLEEEGADSDLEEDGKSPEPLVKETQDLKLAKEGDEGERQEEKTPDTGERAGVEGRQGGGGGGGGEEEEEEKEEEEEEPLRTRILTVEELEELFLEHLPETEGSKPTNP